MTEMINQLTPEQEALISVYEEKWLNISLSTQPIEHEKVTEVLKATYALAGQKEPKIIFFDSPYTAMCFKMKNQLQVPEDRKHRIINRKLDLEWRELLVQSLLPELYERELISHWADKEKKPLDDRLSINPRTLRIMYHQLESQEIDTHYSIQVYIHQYCCLPDFCVSVLNLTLNQQAREVFEIFQLLACHCGLFFAFENIVLVCDRPRIFSVDNQQRLHAEGAPAIQFADGWGVYAYHGVRLPEKYGKLHPNQWQAQWLLEEENAELRRVLIQGIGYARICQELQAIELDSWQEYTLLKIDSDVDDEPIYLLKMTCPSTGYIHAMRVPPDIQSAREAITWVNWGIAPEEFSVQT